VGAVLALVLAAFVWIWMQPSDRVLRQADGREVILKAVTYGTTTIMSKGPAWARALAPLVPASWHRRIRAQVLTIKTPEPALVAWLQWRGGFGQTSGNWAEAGVGWRWEERRVNRCASARRLYLYDKPWGAISGVGNSPSSRVVNASWCCGSTRATADRIRDGGRIPCPQPGPAAFPGGPLLHRWPITRTNGFVGVHSHPSADRRENSGSPSFPAGLDRALESAPPFACGAEGWDAPEWTVESITARDAAGGFVPFDRGEAARDGAGIRVRLGRTALAQRTRLATQSGIRAHRRVRPG
jgi:hypothetical protein